MKYKVKTLKTAYDDLKEIKQYLDQFYPSTVRNFVRLYKSKKDGLKEFPFSHQAYEDDPDYRRLVVGDYLVFYQVDGMTKTVEIHRILHGSRDMSHHLRH